MHIHISYKNIQHLKDKTKAWHWQDTVDKQNKTKNKWNKMLEFYDFATWLKLLIPRFTRWLYTEIHYTVVKGQCVFPVGQAKPDCISRTRQDTLVWKRQNICYSCGMQYYKVWIFMCINSNPTAITPWHAKTITQTKRCKLLWRHNGGESVSNHQPHDYLLNHLFRRRSKKTSKLRVTGLCAGNSPGTGEFSAQMPNNAENVSIWQRHHELSEKK